jgi:hypothetical protein
MWEKNLIMAGNFTDTLSRCYMDEATAGLPLRFGWADGIEYRMQLHSWPLPPTVQKREVGRQAHRACSAAEVPSSPELCRNSDFEQHQQPAIGLLNFCLVNTNHKRDPNHPQTIYQLHHINAKSSTSRHQHRIRASGKIFYKDIISDL